MNVHAPPAKNNPCSISEGTNPQLIEPTHFAWCSDFCVGPKQPIGYLVDQFWRDLLGGMTTINYFPHRSSDGSTIYFVPLLTGIEWRGRC